MSVKWISHVLDCSPYRGTTLLMHMVLADHANDEGICWPSVNRLAKLCRIRRRRAQQILDQLRDDRMYEAERRAGHSTLFRLLTIGGEEDCTPDQSNGEEDCTPGVKGIAPRGEEDCTPGVKPTAPRTVIEPPKEPSEESSGIFYSDQTFWVQTLTAILQTYYKGQESGDFAEYWQPTVAFQHLNGKVTVLCEFGDEQLEWLQARQKIAERMLVGVLGKSTEVVFISTVEWKGIGNADHSED